jgi:N4-gp56 family major capsid protein|nr:MAG TPA: major capsid protein [Caudoviricetes sp.]
MTEETNMNVQTTGTNVPGNSVSGEMKTFYNKQLIRFATPKLVHGRFGQKRPIPPNSGKTIQFRRFSPLPKALKPLEEGVTPRGNALNVSTVTATVDQYGDYITTSDLFNLTAVDNIIAETQTVLGDQAGRTLDTVIREKINCGTNVQYGDGTKKTRSSLVGGSENMEENDYLSVKAVKKAVATLKRNNASPVQDGCYVAIVHPDVANDLTNDPDWKIMQEADKKDWGEGVIGKIHGVVFVESSEAKVFTSKPLASETGDGLLTVAKVDGKEITIAEELTKEQADVLCMLTVYIAGETYMLTSAAPGVRGSAKVTMMSTVSAKVKPGDKIHPGGGTGNGRDTYSTLVLGQNAYGVTEIENGGLESIIKQRGSAGTGDPLNQRSTVGWKATQTAEILSDEFMVRIETACSYR